MTRPELEGVLVVGATRIPYRVRTSARARVKRIVVEPRSVEVVLPQGRPADEAHAFVKAKRRWVLQQRARLGQQTERDRSYLAGSKVRFRGRWLTLEVKPGGSAEGSVTYRSRFDVELPRGTPRADRAAVTRQLLHHWLRQRLRADGDCLGRRYAAALDVEVRGFEVISMRRMWASCGKDCIVRLNPDLIELPRAVLEYVMAHEVSHLLHRNHSPAFWRTVARLIPDWRERQAWLASYERDWEL